MTDVDTKLVFNFGKTTGFLIKNKERFMKETQMTEKEFKAVINYIYDMFH